LQCPAELLDDLAGLYRDIPVLTKELPGDATLWCIGKRKANIIRPIQAVKPDIRPVLIGKERKELFLERDRLAELPSMGFLRDIETPGWTVGLPYPVHAVSLGFRLSSLNDDTRRECLKDLSDLLVMGGLVLWSDFFLPQTLEIHATYLDEYTRIASIDPLDAGRFRETFLEHHPNPVLLETAVNEVYAAGFANAEIVAKRMGIAVLVARK